MLKQRFVSRQKAKIHGERVPVSQWRSLPSDVKNLIYVNLPFTNQLSFKQVSRSSKREIEAVMKLLILTAVHFFIEGGKEGWQCAAFDLVGERWRRVPPYLPKLDPSDPYKDTQSVDIANPCVLMSRNGLRRENS